VIWFSVADSAEDSRCKAIVDLQDHLCMTPLCTGTYHGRLLTIHQLAG